MAQLLRIGILFLLLVLPARAAEIFYDPTRPAAGFLPDRAGLAEGETASEALVLQSILIGKERQFAILNGRLMKVGERIQGHTLQRIHHGGVTLSSSQGSVTLQLVPALQQNVWHKGQK